MYPEKPLPNLTFSDMASPQRHTAQPRLFPSLQAYHNLTPPCDMQFDPLPQAMTVVYR